MGGYKGTGLSLMIELLTAALAGAAFSYQLAEQGSSGVDTSSTKIFIALKSDIFISPDGYKDSTARLFSYFTGCAPQFTFPSERGWLAKRRNLVAGVPLHREIAKQLSQVGIKL